MAKKDLIDAIIKNSERTNMEESDRKYLEGLDEKRLEKMAKLATEKPALSFNTQEDFDKKLKEELDKKVKEPSFIEELKKKQEAELTENKEKDKKPDPPKAQTVEEYLNNAPPQLRQVLNNGLKAHEAEQKRLIGIITSNKQNRFKEDYLKTLDLGVLEGMAAIANNGESVDNAVSGPIYMGAAAPAPAMNEEKEEGMGLPTYNNDRFYGNVPATSK